MSLIGSYNEHDINFTANEHHTHNQVGDQIIFLGGSGQFTFNIDGGKTNLVRAGIAFKMPTGQTFQRITFNETAGSTGNILFAIASGNVTDARSVISGETPILNAASPNNILSVADSAILARLGAVDGSFKKPVTDMRNSTLFRKTTSGSTTIVASGTNTNGVLVHMLGMCAIQNSGYIRLEVGTDRLIELDKVSTQGQFWVERDFILPSGENIILDHGHSDSRSTMSYTVL